MIGEQENSVSPALQKLRRDQTSITLSTKKKVAHARNPHLSFDAPHLFIPLEGLVKLAHTGGTDPRRGQCAVDVDMALLAGFVGGLSACDVLKSLAFVFSDASFACGSGILGRVDVHGWGCMSSVPTTKQREDPTGICLDLMYPLYLLVLVLPIPSPPIDPFLFLLVPHLSLAAFFLDTFGCGETFPFGGCFGFGEGFGAGEGGCGWGELGEGAVGGGVDGEGVEGGDEGLDAVTCGRLEVILEVFAEDKGRK